MANRIPVFLACRGCHIDVSTVLEEYSSTGKLITSHHLKMNSDHHSTQYHHMQEQQLQPRRLSSGDSGLYRENWKGRNEEMLHYALEFLENHRILSNFTTSFVGEYFRERESKCYSNISHNLHSDQPCAVYHCDAKQSLKNPSEVVVVNRAFVSL